MSNNQKNILDCVARYFHTSYFIIIIINRRKKKLILSPKEEDERRRRKEEGVSIPREVPCVIILDSCIGKGEGDDVAKWSTPILPEWATGLHIPNPLSYGSLSGHLPLELFLLRCNSACIKILANHF